MKLAICNEMFEDWQIEDVFLCAAELGYGCGGTRTFHARGIGGGHQPSRKRSHPKSGGDSESRNRWTSLAAGLAKGIARQPPRLQRSARKHGTIFSH